MIRVLLLVIALAACTPAAPVGAAGADASASIYGWERLAEHAAFPPGYNYPVQVLPDGRFAAFHPEGTWVSTDGRAWERTPLPPSGLNSAYLAYVQHNGATWALGRIEGNYQHFSVDPVIQRTRDMAHWEDMGRSARLPHVVFYAAASFQGAMWILGGFDGADASAQIWRSTDGVHWVRAVERAPWSARSGAKAIVFRNRLFLIGGGIIDGPQSNDVWSSGDGVSWRRETASIAQENPVGYSPIVFDDRLWLIGANRSGSFSSEMLVSDDGRTWRAQTAPWSARGGVAPWTDGRTLFITGGKASFPRNGELVFVYSNDVWAMRRR